MKKFIWSLLILIILWLCIESNQTFASTCGSGGEWWGIKNSIQYILQADSILYGQAQVILPASGQKGWTSYGLGGGSQKTKFTWEKVYKGTQDIELVSSFRDSPGQWLLSGYYIKNWEYYLVFSKRDNTWFYEPFFGWGMCSQISAVSQEIDPMLRMILYIYVYRYYLLVWVCALIFYIINHKIKRKKKKEILELNLKNENK